MPTLDRRRRAQRPGAGRSEILLSASGPLLLTLIQRSFPAFGYGTQGRWWRDPLAAVE